jgi:hypothetical protein
MPSQEELPGAASAVLIGAAANCSLPHRTPSSSVQNAAQHYCNKTFQTANWEMPEEHCGKCVAAADIMGKAVVWARAWAAQYRMMLPPLTSTLLLILILMLRR